MNRSIDYLEYLDTSLQTADEMMAYRNAAAEVDGDDNVLIIAIRDVENARESLPKSVKIRIGELKKELEDGIDD